MPNPPPPRAVSDRAASDRAASDRAVSPTRLSHADPRQALGAIGERLAERWLCARGWRVVARRFRSGHRDVDLIVAQPGLIAFVEVKSRRGPAFGGPLEAVHWRKRRELVRSAQVWIARHGPPDVAYRFDVVGVAFGPGARPAVRVRHVADAFQVPANQ